MLDCTAKRNSAPTIFIIENTDIGPTNFSDCKLSIHYCSRCKLRASLHFPQHSGNQQISWTNGDSKEGKSPILKVQNINKSKWVQKHYNKFSKAPLNLVILGTKDLEFSDSSFKWPRRYARISQYNLKQELLLTQTCLSNSYFQYGQVVNIIVDKLKGKSFENVAFAYNYFLKELKEKPKISNNKYRKGYKQVIQISH